MNRCDAESTMVTDGAVLGCTEFVENALRVVGNTNAAKRIPWAARDLSARV
jgi:hypothetical protein